MRCVTISYSIVNEKVWAENNPLRFRYNGLKAHRVAIYDAFERLDRCREELERLRDLVCPTDAERIDAALNNNEN